MSQARYASYSDLTNPALKDAINQNCLSTIHLAALVADFAQEVSEAYKLFAKDIHRIVSQFRDKSSDLKKERFVDTPSTIYNAWENLIKETEFDAQAHMDAAGLLIKNVSEPLNEVAKYKKSQAQKLQAFRENFEDMLHHSEQEFQEKEQMYMDAYGTFKNCGSLDNREGLRHEFHNAHNEYILQIRASNRLIDDFQCTIPQVLEELDEIYIDTSNTVNVAIESHSLLLLTKASEQQRQLESLLKCCRQVNPMLDISYFVKAINTEEATVTFQRHRFCPAEHIINSTDQEFIMNHLILDRVTEVILGERRAALQKEALELASYIKQNQAVNHSLVNMCQRNLANHLYAKVYETQEDMCRKRNEIRVANLQLGVVRSQIELLTPKQNGSMDDDQEKKNPSTIRGMWKKAFKTLKSSSSVEKLRGKRKNSKEVRVHIHPSVKIEIDDYDKGKPDAKKLWRRLFNVITATRGFTKVSKKSSFSKKKQSSKEADDEVEQVNAGPVDPVYSLLKCAADLPRSGGKSPCLLHQHCSGQHTPAYVRYPSGGDSSGNTSKTSSPSSSALNCSYFSGSANENVLHSSGPAYLHLDHTFLPDEHTPSTNQIAARACCHAAKTCDHSHIDIDINKVYSKIQHKVSPMNTPDIPEDSEVPCFTGSVISEGTASSPGTKFQLEKKSEFHSRKPSISHSPKTRRKKLNARMKSFSLDTPEPPKQLLGIDESTKKKSSSFTNTCFGGTQSPDEKLAFSATNLRKKFAFAKASSLEMEEKKVRSFSPSPKGSPKSQRKEIKNLHVAVYNFKAKEKDDIDLRAGWRVSVTDSSNKDWWKGKSHGRSGYFPATYVIPLQTDQRVFQVLQPLNLSDGSYSIKFHKDQIVLQIGEEVDGMILVRAANNRQALCPLQYLQEL